MPLRYPDSSTTSCQRLISSCHTLFLKNVAPESNVMIRINAAMTIILVFFRSAFSLPAIINTEVVIAINAPIEGRYNLCSNITSMIGITLYSTESVIKNQRMPKATNRE